MGAHSPHIQWVLDDRQPLDILEPVELPAAWVWLYGIRSFRHSEPRTWVDCSSIHLLIRFSHDSRSVSHRSPCQVGCLGIHNAEARHHRWWGPTQLLHSFEAIASSQHDCWGAEHERRIPFRNPGPTCSWDSRAQDLASQSHARHTILQYSKQPSLYRLVLLHWCWCWRKREIDWRWRLRRWGQLWAVWHGYGFVEPSLCSRLSC